MTLKVKIGLSYKDPVRTAQYIHSLCYKNQSLNAVREILAVYSEIHTKHTDTLCGRNVELVNVKPAVQRVTIGL
jgi:hypothetical protein